MDVKVSKEESLVDGKKNTLVDGLMWLSSTSNEIVSNTKRVMNRGKRGKTLNEVKPVNKTENNQRFPIIVPMQKEVLPMHKL